MLHLVDLYSQLDTAVHLQPQVLRPLTLLTTIDLYESASVCVRGDGRHLWRRSYRTKCCWQSVIDIIEGMQASASLQQYHSQLHTGRRPAPQQQCQSRHCRPASVTQDGSPRA